MVIHRFAFLIPVQLPGRAPVVVFEPASVTNIGYTATRTADGWLFTGPPGQTSGLSTGGRDELAAIGQDPAAASLAVLVPHAQVVVQYAGAVSSGEPFNFAALPTSAPSFDLEVARAKVAEDARRQAERAAADPPAPPPVVAAPAPAPPPTSRRRSPLPPPPAPPPSVGWVADE